MPQHAIINSIKEKVQLEAKAGMFVITFSNADTSIQVSVMPDDMEFLFDAFIKIGRELEQQKVTTTYKGVGT